MVVNQPSQGANAEKHRQGHDAFRRQDMQTLARFITDDTIWHTSGQSPVSGTYKGRDEIFQTLQTIIEITGGTLSLEDIDVTDSDEHSVALSRMTARRDDDRTLDVQFIEVVRWDGDAIAERWGVADDPYAADAFFS